MLFEKEKVKLSERERQMRAMEREQAVVLGSRFKLLFIIHVASVAASFASYVATYLEAGFGVIAVISGISLAMSILFAVILFMLGKYNGEFTMAGLTFIMAQIATFCQSISPSGVSMMFSIMAAALSVGYVIKFTSGMEACVTPADGYLAESWEKFRNYFIYVTIFTVCCTVLVFFPGILKVLAAIGILLAAIVALILSVWQIVLLYRSANTMTAFSQTPIDE